MIALGLSTADRVKFETSLYGNHAVKITISLLDLNHRYITDLSSRLVDGQITVDGNADVTRSATLTLLDPEGIMDLDSDSPADASMFLDRMVRITYSVWSDLLPRWVDVPVFCGPIRNFSRDDALVSVEAQGKEALFLPPTVAWYAETYKKGANVANTVRDIMADRGETRFQFPAWTLRTTRDWTITRESNIWQFCKNVVGPLRDRQLFYDGRGVAVLRSTPKAVTFTFNESMLVSRPKVTFDASTIRNSVYVVGGTPTGKPQITASLGAPRTHPVSSWKLGRNGKQNIMMEKVQDDTLMTKAAAQQRAEDVLESVLLQQVAVEFSSFVIPHLEPEDIYRLTTRDFAVNQRVKQITIPLKVGNTMTVGYLAKRSANIGRIRGR